MLMDMKRKSLFLLILVIVFSSWQPFVNAQDVSRTRNSGVLPLFYEVGNNGYHDFASGSVALDESVRFQFSIMMDSNAASDWIDEKNTVRPCSGPWVTRTQVWFDNELEHDSSDSFVSYGTYLHRDDYGDSVHIRVRVEGYYLYDGDSVLVYNEGETTFLYADVGDEINTMAFFSISIIGSAILVVVIAYSNKSRKPEI
ncbi:MAG: hypothetical protein ACTSV2_07610 [Candidatus Thorarchaeota archaeon]